MANRMKSPLLRYAAAFGFTVIPRSRHWLALHPEGGRALIPFGTKLSVCNERNYRASLRRAAKALEVG